MLIVLVAIADLRWSFWWAGGRRAIGICAGSVAIQSGYRNLTNRFWVNVAYEDLSDAWEAWTQQRGLPVWKVIDGRDFVLIPLWIPFAVVGLPTAWLWYAGRRPAPGACRCGYDLTGNMSGRCPECGRVVV